MRKIICILLMILLIASNVSYSQSDNNKSKYDRKQEFENFKQKKNAEFLSFKDSLDKEFSKMIEKKWEEYETFVSNKRPTKPEPTILPIAPKDSSAQESIELPANEIYYVPKNDSNDDSKENIYQNEITESDEYSSLDINHYMNSLQFNMPNCIENLVLSGISEKDVAKFWQEISECDVAVFENQIIQYKNELNLNDWAVYDLLSNIAGEVFKNGYAEQTVFSVFLLNHLGFDAKVGRIDNQLVILLPTQSTIYAVSYIKDGIKPYYIFSSYPNNQQVQGKVKTYSISHPSARKAFDMNIALPIRFVSNLSSVTYSTNYWGNPVAYNVNQNAIDFYSRYPQVDIVIYANAQMSEELKNWSEKQIKPFLDDLDEYESVNVILNYVQTAFEYASDFEQFGFEKPFFCEENFYYGKNDCEDRSILFSYFIRNLVGTDIVLLDYPDHIATAVCLSRDDINGDYFVINDKKYFVCDPTYIGANIGESIPKYKQVKPNIIVLNNY